MSIALPVPRPQRVLVVDDVRMDRELLKGHLSDIEIASVFVGLLDRGLMRKVAPEV